MIHKDTKLKETLRTRKIKSHIQLKSLRAELFSRIFDAKVIKVADQSA